MGIPIVAAAALFIGSGNRVGKTLEEGAERIARYIQEGKPTAVAVLATAYATTRSTACHHGSPTLASDPQRGIDYAETPLAAEYVLASAAIPGAFPAVEISSPAMRRAATATAGCA